MTVHERPINLYSDGAAWQNFFNAMLAFTNSRIKAESTADLYLHGLEVYLHFPNSIKASLFLLDTDVFLFHHSFSLPNLDIADVQGDFNSLLEQGAIASVLQTGLATPWSLLEAEKNAKNYLLIPLIENTGVIGLILLELISLNNEYEQLMLGLCSFHSNQFTTLINNLRLVKELKNTQSILEQRISLRTEDLRKSKRDLQLILDSIHTGVFLIDPKSNEIVDANLAALDILKMQREWVINANRNIFTRDYDKDESRSSEKFNEVSESESTLVDRDGKSIPVIRTVANINFGEHLYILESFVDISERKSTMKALMESESRFRTIFEKAGIGIVLTDLSGRILEANSTFLNMVEYLSSELLRQNMKELIHDDNSEVIRSINYSSNKSYREVKIVKKNGSLIWCRITSTFMRDSNDNPLFGLEMVEDITESKNHEEVLERQTNLLNGVAEASTILVSEMDFTVALRKVLKLIGQAAEVDRVYIYQFEDSNEVIIMQRKFGWSRIPNDKMESQNQNYSFNLRKTESSWYKTFLEERTICGLTKNVSDLEKEMLKAFDVRSFLAVPINVKDKVWGFIGFDDCSEERIWTENEESILKAMSVAIGGAIERNHYQQEILEAKDKAEKSFKLKSEFLAQMSHEIRTPINSILNFSGIIKEELANKIDDDLKTGLKIIDKAGKRIIRTMDLILNMSDIQTGHYDYCEVEINLFSDILERQYLEFIQHARDKNLQFKLHKPMCNTDLKCDSYTINQTFNNLIDNALKYTMKGSVEIFVDQDSNGDLVASIKDTGIGISKDYMPKLFDPFTQEEQGYTRKFEGNGLGMALVKKYCDLNKAQIDVESEKGIGTTFRITFKRNHIQ